LLDLVAFAPTGTTIPFEPTSASAEEDGTIIVNAAAAAHRMGTARVRRVDMNS
jgi:hypothetical protein